MDTATPATPAPSAAPEPTAEPLSTYERLIAAAETACVWIPDPIRDQLGDIADTLDAMVQDSAA
jgi:hypothetical protein